MILDYAAKPGHDSLTVWARCKIAGLAVLLVACLWGSVGFIGETVRKYSWTGDGGSCLVEVAQPGVPSRRSVAETEGRTAMPAAAMLLGAAMVCGVSLVRTRNRPESHRWVQSR